MARNRLFQFLALAWLVITPAGLSWSQSDTQAQQIPVPLLPQKKPNAPDWSRLTGSRSKAILDQCRSKGADDARDDANALLTTVAVYAPRTETQAYIDAAYTARLVDLLTAEEDPSQQAKLLDYLLKHEALSRELAFAVCDSDDKAGVLAALSKLIEAEGEKAADYPTLTAALCVVHDQPLVRHVNENKAESTDVVSLFNYYTTNERRLLLGIRDMPTDLLICVVDTTASIDEMTWALDKYAGDREVGKRFFDIKYDYAHLKTARPKQITLKGFTLQNIFKYGGVCADQAYFASTVAKAIGDPSAIVSAQSGDVGHAWVGFLQAQGGGAAWNFNLGRYPEYQGLRGATIDPQTRKIVYDGFLGVRAELLGIRPRNRYAAKAMTDAAKVLSRVSEPSKIKPHKTLDAEETVEFNKPRSSDTASVLGTLDMAVRHNPCLDQAWFFVRDLAGQGKLSLAEKKNWADKLQRLTGKKYPDFMYAILEPMIQTIDAPNEQNKFWEAAFSMMTLRKDLAAEVRMAQAAMWEKQNKPRLAGPCYEDVIDRFANAGPFVVKALRKTEQMLSESGLSDRVLRLYAQTWQRLDKPSGMAGVFSEQSNWYQVGLLYEKKLRQAGQTTEADSVAEQLKKVVGG